MKSILYSVAVLVAATEASSKSCTGLALSGGGANGAWEAGVIWGLLHYGNPKDFEYQVMSGVSAGSINILGMAGWKIGQEVEMSEFLSEVWQNITDGDIYKDWTFGPIQGIL